MPAGRPTKFKPEYNEQVELAKERIAWLLFCSGRIPTDLNRQCIWPLWNAIDIRDIEVLNTVLRLAVKRNMKAFKFLFGIEDERHSEKAVLWRGEIFLRDNWTCCDCGNRNDLHAHHIKSWAEYPELRFDLNNGITLCRECHALKHPKHANLIRNSRKHRNGHVSQV